VPQLSAPSYPLFLNTGLAGQPTTHTPSATLFTTTAPAPMTALSPTLMPCLTADPMPTQAPSPMRTPPARWAICMALHKYCICTRNEPVMTDKDHLLQSCSDQAATLTLRCKPTCGQPNSKKKGIGFGSDDDVASLKHGIDAL